MILRRAFIKRMAIVALASGWLDKRSLVLPAGEPTTVTTKLMIPIMVHPGVSYWVAADGERPRAPEFARLELLVSRDIATGKETFSPDGELWYDNARDARDVALKVMR